MIRSASLSLTALLLAATPALAQQPQTSATDDATPTLPDSRPLSAEESAALAEALAFDPTGIAAKVPTLKAPGQSQKSPFAMTHSTQADGSTTYTLKRALPSLDANVGADLGTGPAPSAYYDPDRPFVAPGGNTGAAWASVDVISGASIDARLNPTADQGRLATTLHHSVPFGSRFALTLQNTSGFTDSLGTTTTTSVPGGLPMRTLPQADPTGSTQVWDDQPSLKFDVLSTGTSLTAGFARSSDDPVTHNRIGADQQLYGPLHVSTSVTDIGEATENRSISAGFKFHW